MLLEDLKKEFLFDCKVRELTERTCKNYEKQMKMFLRFLEMDCAVIEIQELKPLHIKQFIYKNQKSKKKPSYINDLLRTVKCFCGYAFREGYTDELITKRVQNVKEPKVLIHTFSNNEIKGMIEYYRGDDFLNIRNRLILMMLFDTGIRITELLDMREEQILDGCFIIYGKGRKERIVPKNVAVSKWLIKYKTAKEQYFILKDTQSFLFLSKNGKQLTEEAIRKMMVKAAEDIGVNPSVRVSPHTCRHTFAHQQLKNGLDLYSLSRILGHESVSITQRYLEAIEDSQIITSSRKAGVLSNL